jgi:hypothetical protein
MFACFCHILLLYIFSQSLGFIYIFLLGGLVAAVEQEDNFVLADCVIYPVSGACVHTHFVNTASHWLVISKITKAGPVNSLEYIKNRLAIPELLQPSVKFFVFLTLNSTPPTVAPRRHIVNVMRMF